MPNPFTAEIVFTGLCGVVPKVNPTHPPDPQTLPGGFCFLLPNAWKRKPDVRRMRISLDQTSRLRRHTPFVCFTTHPWDMRNRRQDLEGLWFLQGHRLMIIPEFEDTSSSIGPAWGNIAGLAGFEDVASVEKQGLLRVKKAVTAPDAKRIAAQVVIPYGTLSAEPLEADWVFDSFLRPEKPLVVKPLNHRITVALENLRKLTVVRQSFNGTLTGRSFIFSKGPASITVANLCDQNPLQWGEEPPPESLTDDDDFRWHYEIVDEPDRLRDALGRLRCPIPRVAQVPLRGASEAHRFFGGGGLNCVGFRFPAVDFTF